MRLRDPWKFMALGLLIGMASAIPIAAQSQKQIKQATKLLGKIKLVDGAGSGLDADTLQGLTPAQIEPSPQSALAAIKQVDGAGSGIDADTLQGFTPAQLAAGGGSGFSVVDSQGLLVGALDIGEVQMWVLRQVGSAVLLFEVEAEGFVETQGLNFEHLTPDCLGPRYVASSALARLTQVVGTTAYYASDPVELKTTAAQELMQPDCVANGGTVLANGFCCVPSVDSRRVGVATTLNLTTLALVPPFRVQ